MHTIDNAFALLIYHIVQDNIVLPAIYQDFGTQIQKNAKAVIKMHILIQVENHV